MRSQGIDRNFIIAEKIEREQARRRRLEAVKTKLISSLAIIDWKLSTDVFDEKNHLSDSRIEELEAIVLKIKELVKHLGE